MTTKTKYGWLTLRWRFLGASLFHVRRTAWAVLGAVTVIVGGSIVAGVGWALDRPLIAVGIGTAILSLLLLEGAFRLLGGRTSELAARTEELEALQARRGAIQLGVSYSDPVLSVGASNAGKTIHDVGLNVLIPKLPGLMLQPMDGTTGGPAAVGPIDIAEKELIPGVPTLRFAVGDLKIPGGATMKWHFRVGSVHGKLPIQIAVGADELEGWTWLDETILANVTT